MEERRFSEEEIERGASVSELVEVEGRQVVRIRWNTGKTSAGRLFGRYGREGRPDFFRLLFGSIAGSLRQQFGEKGEEIFGRIRDSREFRETTRKIFDDMKAWFFNEVAPRHNIEPGDIFMIITQLEVDPNTGVVTWDRDKTEVVFWVRSDRCVQRETDECRALKEENERLRTELEEVRKRVEELTRLLESR